MNKQQFDQAIGEVPPSTVDVDGVVARERRAALVRRVASPWVAAAAGVVAITFGVAVAVVPGTDPGGARSPAQPPETSTSSAAPATPRSPCDHIKPTGPPAPEQPAVAAARLTGVLTAAVRRHLPADTALTPNRAPYPVGEQPHAPLEFVHAYSVAQESNGGCQGGEDEFVAGASAVRSGKTGSIQAIVSRLGGRASPSTECGTGGTTVGYDTDCVTQTGPGGETIVRTTLKQHGGGSTMFWLDVTRPDGTGIILVAADVGDPKRESVPSAAAPPLTFEQLIDVALDPGMTLYP